jgi:type II secretory pathway component GspD/PulD (secretin)
MTAVTDEGGEATLTGEERSFINNILAAHISVPEIIHYPNLPVVFQPPQLRQFAQQLSDKLDEAEISPGLRMKVRKFMKGSLARVEAGAQAEDDYSHTKVAENARAARKKASSKIV